MSLKLTTRMYWFLHNLIRLPFCIIAVGIFFPIYAVFASLKIAFFVTDGSETLAWPWE